MSDDARPGPPRTAPHGADPSLTDPTQPPANPWAPTLDLEPRGLGRVRAVAVDGFVDGVGEPPD
jgi:hypothetical protein